LQSDEVRAVSFTGSSVVGGSVALTAAARNIRYQTEMGGKNVAIVARDADLDLAASLTANGAMRYAGQKCTATSRVVVDKKVEAPFLEKLFTQIEAMPLGPVMDPKAVVGPLINEEARNSINRVLQSAEGARVIRMALPDDEEFNKGFYLAPTVVTNVHPSSEIAQRELFGPVLASIVAQDFDEAIDLANQTQYGLSASLFTKDIRAALHYAHRIAAGLVRVNGDTTGVDPHAPFGGMKGSSSGSREQGPAARDFYTEIKTVQINP
jgi:aldehyde dehydrogenase (NAD+)